MAIKRKTADSPADRKVAVGTLELASLQGQLAAISKTQAVLELRLDGTIITANENYQNMDGITLVRELRLLPHYRGVPLLVLTTEASAQKKLEGKAAGATGWVVKPFSPDRLLATIARIVA
jgi:two-component system, chemotaxis family, chemotaxis protein CheY